MTQTPQSPPSRVILSLVIEQQPNGTYAISETLVDGKTTQLAVGIVTAGAFEMMLKRLPTEVPALLAMQRHADTLRTDIGNTLIYQIAEMLALKAAQGQYEPDTDATATGSPE